MESKVLGKEDEQGKIPDFRTIPFTDTKKVLEEIQKAGKYAYIADLTGKLGTYFEYSGHNFFDF